MQNKYFLQDKRDGRIRQISDNIIDYDKNIFDLVKMNIPDNDLVLVMSGKKKIKIEDKKLTIVNPND